MYLKNVCQFWCWVRIYLVTFLHLEKHHFFLAIFGHFQPPVAKFSFIQPTIWSIFSNRQCIPSNFVSHAKPIKLPKHIQFHPKHALPRKKGYFYRFYLFYPLFLRILVKSMVLKQFNRLHELNQVRWDQDTLSVNSFEKIDHFEWVV